MSIPLYARLTLGFYCAVLSTFAAGQETSETVEPDCVVAMPAPTDGTVMQTDDVLCKDGVCINVVPSGWHPAVDDSMEGFDAGYATYRRQAAELLRCRTTYCQQVSAGVHPLPIFD